MLGEIWYIVDMLGMLLVSACLVRAWGHWVSLHPRDVVMQFSATVTDWIVQPLRKIIPMTKGRDWASMIAAFLIALVLGTAFYLLVVGFGSGLGPFAILRYAFVTVIRTIWYLVMAVIFIQAILSWVNPNAPIAPALAVMTRPLLQPFRLFLAKIFPNSGGIDFSPMLLIITMMLLQRVVFRMLGAF